MISKLLPLPHHMLGTLLLIVLPLAGIGGAVTLLLLGQYGFLELSSYMVIPMVLAPVIYLAYRRKKYTVSEIGGQGFKALLIVYLLLFSVSTYLLYVSDIRPVMYYVVIAAMATVILLQILLCVPDRPRTGAILMQVMALTLNIIWGISLKYFYFIGRTDIAGHAWFVENILRYGHVTETFEVYQSFPLWHFISATLYMISSSTLPVHIVMYVACGLVYALTILAVYYLTRQLTGSVRAGMLSSLFTSFCLIFIIQGTEAMPRSITGCLLIILLILLMGSKDRRHYPLAILLTLGVIVFHTVSIAFFLVILFLLYAAAKLFRSREAFPLLDLPYFLISTGMAVVYWVLSAGVLLQKLFYNLDLSGTTPTGIITRSVVETPITETFNYLQYMPLLLFILLGILLALRSSGKNRALVMFSVITLVMIPLTFPGPLLLLNQLNANLGIDRFYENGYMFMSLTAAVGFLVIFNKAGKLMKTAMVVLFAVLVLLSVSNDFVATDNPLVKRPFYTHYLTASDISGANLFRDAANGTVLADYPIVRYLMYNDYVELPLLIRADEKNNSIVLPDPIPLIYRKGELSNRPLDIMSVDGIEATSYGYFVPWTSLAYIDKSSPVWDSLKKHNRIYDSNTMEGYY